ncbi:hypothetical protein KY284_012263 [Solanum tuberosum]|nr:hypothetical protein KY284_012263 [Solanum tuberosum]
MTYSIDVHTSKKLSQPLKCRRLKKSISQSLSIVSKRKKINDYCFSITLKPKRQGEGKEKEEEEEEEKEQEKEEEDKDKEQEKEKEKVKKKSKEKEKEKDKDKEKVKKKAKEKVKKKAKEKEKKKEKKFKVVSCDVKQQYPFEGFNIDGEGPSELISSFSQWINEGIYKHHAKKRDKDDHYLANYSNLEFKQLNFVVAFSKSKDWFYVMSQPNKCWTDEYVDVILYYLRRKSKQQSHSKYRYTTTNYFFKTYIDNANDVPEYENKIVSTIKGFGIPARLPWHLTDEGKNKSHPFEVIHVTGIAQQSSNSLDCGVFVAAYAEFLSDGLQIPSDGIISQSLRLRYASLLLYYGILKGWSDYIKVVVAIFSTTSVVICCDPLLQQDVVALIISSLSLISSQPNATGDSIMRSAMGKSFDTFRITLKQNDLNNNISLKWVNLSQDIEPVNNYPWGHESLELTIKYLLKPLGPKTINLFGFPWDFMAWTVEVIPHLIRQVNAEEEILSPRILRWLRSKTKTAKNIPDLYNPPHDAVVHPWLVPTEKELQMPYLITLGLVETLFDPVVDRVKMELAGARTIKRDRVVNELVVFDGVDGHGIDASAGVGQDQGATSCRKCSGFLCEKCKKQDEDSIMYLRTLSKAAKRRKKSFIKAIQNLKKKIFGELPKAYVDEILSLMRERNVRYPEYYDSTYRILDLNFYSNFKLRYDKMSEEATTIGGRTFTQLINEFEWDEYMINYVRGIRPYPGGMDWIVQKGFR